MSLPLHPIIVHFPVVLGLMMPLSSGLMALAVLNRKARLRSWWLVLGHAGLLVISTMAAMRTGEGDGELAQRIVPEHAIQEHEERGEILLAMAGLTLVAASGVMVRNASSPLKRGMMVGCVAFSVGSAVAAAWTAHAGGRLVYEFGAADVHRPDPAESQPKLFEHPADEDAADENE